MGHRAINLSASLPPASSRSDHNIIRRWSFVKFFVFISKLVLLLDMYRKHHTKGIVISSKVEGDSNKRVNLFTESFGLLNAKVQGGRNMHSKFRSGSQDFSYGDFSLIHGKTGWRVVGVSSEQNFYESFRNSPDKMRIVSNVLNLIKKLTDEEKINSQLFTIVSNFLNFLLADELSRDTFKLPRSQKAPFDSIALTECLTLIRILHSLGYMRHDPEFMIPMTSSEIEIKDLEAIAPRRAKMVALINESLKAT